MSSIRVAQWGTGVTGKMALRAIIESPDLELVALRVYDAGKVGKDAGEIAGTPATGISATNSDAKIIAARPDVVLYAGAVEKNPDSCFAEVIALLEAGINVSTTGSSFIDARAFDPARGAAVEEACRKGGSTLLGAGLYPGFFGEVIAPLLSRLSFKCGEITIRESLSYAGYSSTEMMFDVMGYGRPPEAEGALSSRAGRPNPFTATAAIVAKALGLKVTATEPYRLKAITQKELHVAAGTIPAGTVGAQKIGVRAECGPIAIKVEHVTWMDPEVEPEWSRGEGYEIEFDGEPTLRCSLVLGIRGEDHTDMGCLATAMHAVNAIPVVNDAQPGILDLADVPAFVGSMRGPR